jgi:mannitol/fructose-specific phosphotransferase system IIA component
MDRVILNNGLEYPISQAVGTDSKLSFTVIGITNFKDLRDSLTKSALAIINLYTGTTLGGVYEKFITVLPFEITAAEDGTLNITVNLARMTATEDAVEKLIISGLGA